MYLDIGVVIHAVHLASNAPNASAGITNSQHAETVQLEWAILSGTAVALAGIAHIVYRTGKAMSTLISISERVARLEAWRDSK